MQAGPGATVQEPPADRRLDGLSQKFRMLMASTTACYKLFREKQKEGHGEAIMFKGECPRGPGSQPAPGGPLGGRAGERFDPDTQLRFRSSSPLRGLGVTLAGGGPASAAVSPTSRRRLPLRILDSGLGFFGPPCGTLQRAPAPKES